MKFKSLILKFGLGELEGTCVQKGWRVPSSEELISVPGASEHREVWVSDLPPKEEDRETHGMLYDVDKGTFMLSHKNHKHHAVVIVEKHTTKCKYVMGHHKGDLVCEIGCNGGSEFTTYKEAKKWNVCPFCGREIAIFGEEK